MTREIKVGTKNITFTANGATPVFFKEFFHKDILKEMASAEDYTEIASEYTPQLAFIMAKQADKADMFSLKAENYIEFLELFDALDLTQAGKEIFSVFLANTKATEEAKKNKSDQVKE